MAFSPDKPTCTTLFQLVFRTLANKNQKQIRCTSYTLNVFSDEAFVQSRDDEKSHMTINYLLSYLLIDQ